jgi:hypothetical protein
MLKQEPDPSRKERRAALKQWRKDKRAEGQPAPKFRDGWSFYQEKKIDKAGD